jgi:hypothetical protein
LVIRGLVSAAGVPTVTLSVAGKDGPATIDTGFNGDLELPQDLLREAVFRYLVEVDASDNISFQDALIVAMKRERAALKFYSDMAEAATDANLSS